jgi:N-acetylglucosaminyl-diphospho-decaprenol L-rhamnosyltransferase
MMCKNTGSYASCAVIIVTHNSMPYIDKCMQCVRCQTLPPAQVIIIDSGSACTNYLEAYQKEQNTQVYFSQKNIGFCQGNNIGLSLVQENIEHILFLNPDAFLSPPFLEQAVYYMNENPKLGALSGLLLGYDMALDRPTHKIDSSGIFRTWYGRWYDRDQGLDYRPEYYISESVPALCGALMFCRKKALESALLGPHEAMDEAFYMYKEDIDLSLRLRGKGWDLQMLPHLIAYHCRGWQKDRKQVSRTLRLLSAKNEMKLFARLRSPCIFYSMLKYCAVKFLDR